MILVVDAGNTHVHIGMFTLGRLRATWKLASDIRRTSDEYSLMLSGVLGDNIRVSGAIISSVVPPLTPTLSAAVEKSCNVSPMILSNKLEMGIINGYENPHEVGMDRLANSVGGYYFYGAPLLTIDYGTAVTLDYLANPETPGGLPVYKGGAIMPGIHLAMQALGRGTSKLPLVDLSEPGRVIGGTTIESIRSGMVHGYLGAITALVDHAREEIGEPVRVVSTGGDALWFKDRMPFLHDVQPDLTLYGLRQIYGLNNDCPLPDPQ